MATHDPAPSAAGATPLSIRRVLAESVGTFRRGWRPLLILAAVIELPLVLAEVVLEVTPSLRGLVEEESLVGIVALLTIYGSLSHHFLAGLLERVVSTERRGLPRPPLRAVVRHLPWLRLVVADLMLTALIVGGLAFFLLPGLVISTWFALTLPIINLEDRTVVSAFGRSYRLVRGHSGRVAVIAIGAFLVPEAVVGLVGAALHTGNVAVDIVVHAIPATLLLPLAALPLVVATIDLVALDASRARHRAPGSSGG